MQQFTTECINLVARMRAARTSCLNARMVPLAFQLTGKQIKILLENPNIKKLPAQTAVYGIAVQKRKGTDDKIILLVEVPDFLKLL